MRHRVPALLLLGVLPLTNVLAAPAPEPSAILDIGPPPKGMTAEAHRKAEIERLPYFYIYLLLDPEAKKVPSAVSLKKGRHIWLEKQLRITEEEGGHRLRLTFRAGNRTEQVVVLNALLRAYIQLIVTERIQSHEKGIRWDEACILDLEKRIESAQNKGMTESYRKGINDLRLIHIPVRRTEIARLKQVDVIKWAK